MNIHDIRKVLFLVFKNNGICLASQWKSQMTKWKLIEYSIEVDRFELVEFLNNLENNNISNNSKFDFLLDNTSILKVETIKNLLKERKRAKKFILYTLNWNDFDNEFKKKNFRFSNSNLITYISCNIKYGRGFKAVAEVIKAGGEYILYDKIKVFKKDLAPYLYCNMFGSKESLKLWLDIFKKKVDWKNVNKCFDVVYEDNYLEQIIPNFNDCNVQKSYFFNNKDEELNVKELFYFFTNKNEDYFRQQAFFVLVDNNYYLFLPESIYNEKNRYIIGKSKLDCIEKFENKFLNTKFYCSFTNNLQGGSQFIDLSKDKFSIKRILLEIKENIDNILVVEDEFMK